MSSPKLFAPLALRGCVARNRVVISPMSTCSANARGLAQPWHLAHLSKFAMGGAGIVFTEATAIDPRGRVTHSDLGLWSDEHAAALLPAVEVLRAQGALAGIQLAHSGRRGAAQKPWGGKGPLTDEDARNGEPPWPLWGPSAMAARDGCQVPIEMTHAMIDDVQQAFVRSAALADRAGFDVLELHGGHGYLIHSFLSPIANQRADAYGGTRERRMRFALETVERVRDQWPAHKPLFFRASVFDGVAGGWEMADTIVLAAALKERGVDVIDTSSGGIEGTSSNSLRIARVPGYHVPYSATIRRTTGMLTQTVGLIRTPQHAEEILQSESADLVAIGREALYDPFWAVHAAQALKCDEDFEAWPHQYAWWLRARAQFLGPAATQESPLKESGALPVQA